MKTRLAMAAAFVAALTASADATDTVIAATIRDDGSTNTWTQSDLTDALGMINRKYWRDMRTADGRRDWHGGVVESRLETNEATRVIQRVDRHSDGFVWRETGSKVRPLSPEDAADAAARRRDARQKRIDFLRENIARLIAEGSAPATNDEQIAAAAMARINAKRYQKSLDRLLAEQTTNVVNVVISPQTTTP